MLRSVTFNLIVEAKKKKNALPLSGDCWWQIERVACFDDNQVDLNCYYGMHVYLKTSPFKAL